jgi:Putative Ig domain
MARLILALIFSGCLAACRTDSAGNQPAAGADQPQPVVNSGVNNVAPTISGVPATAAQAGAQYQFQPSASDANGDRLTFSVINKPTWASFDSLTGRLTGLPDASQAGLSAGIAIHVSDGQADVSLPPFAIKVLTGNASPTISGTPIGSLVAGSNYSFSPMASDANGDKLTFSIQNKPAWAAFDPATGRLSGMPDLASVGNYRDITISVSDGSASVALPVFSIDVTQIALGNATLSWAAPTQNTDGSPLTDLAGYRIYFGTSAANLSQSVAVDSPGVVTYAVNNLSPATWYFSVKAYTASNVESDFSQVASKRIQ